MKILVTGATGFIGSYIVPLLLADGHSVYCLKRKTSDTWRTTDWKRRVLWFSFARGDYDTFFSRHPVDCIVHLASKYIKYERTARDIRELNEANITFPSLLLHCAVKHNLKYFINTGSCFEYKETRNPITETSATIPFNYYAATKLMFEEVLRYYSQTQGLKAITLRPFFAYGEKDNPKVIPAIIRSVIHSTPLTIHSADSRINFTYVRDIAEAYRLCVTYIPHAARGYDVINIGANRPVTLRHIVEQVTNIAKRRETRISIATSKSPGYDYQYMVSSFAKAKKLLGWKPKYTLDGALKLMYNYYEHHA